MKCQILEGVDQINWCSVVDVWCVRVVDVGYHVGGWNKAIINEPFHIHSKAMASLQWKTNKAWCWCHGSGLCIGPNNSCTFPVGISFDPTEFFS